MEPDRLYKLLEQVRDGFLPIEDAMTALRDLPFEDLGFAKLDHHRTLRTGFPEVVYCPGKTTEHILAILEKLTARTPKILATRATPEVAEAVLHTFPSATYHAIARILVVPGNTEGERENHGEHGGHGEGQINHGGHGEHGEVQNSPNRPPTTDHRPPEHPAPYSLLPILVLAAGTADLPVAEEAAVTASEMGSPVETLYDVGVAGLHRLLAYQDKLFAANVLIVVAEMEGALPSVVGGLVSRPVIAVPTSVGYGASFGGLSALLTMLNSCASGIGVVNIDNGFGAGYLAHLINIGNQTYHVTAE